MGEATVVRLKRAAAKAVVVAARADPKMWEFAASGWMVAAALSAVELWKMEGGAEIATMLRTSARDAMQPAARGEEEQVYREFAELWSVHADIVENTLATLAAERRFTAARKRRRAAEAKIVEQETATATAKAALKEAVARRRDAERESERRETARIAAARWRDHAAEVRLAAEVEKLRDTDRAIGETRRHRREVEAEVESIVDETRRLKKGERRKRSRDRRRGLVVDYTTPLDADVYADSDIQVATDGTGAGAKPSGSGPATPAPVVEEATPLRKVAPADDAAVRAMIADATAEIQEILDQAIELAGSNPEIAPLLNELAARLDAPVQIIRDGAGRITGWRRGTEAPPS